ncbi:MAG: hypothetical protein J0I47_03305 [Sphingomonas sp.]|uniref:hypothetical protein n=1 Tax=Sphingomonas sp. TaxID=28214 RepID=UPI001AC234F6|nr:hypothetical protein [Sphingomonas sp.]MBN8807254.1 hypothetical protein [Sphingomonas sp.]
MPAEPLDARHTDPKNAGAKSAGRVETALSTARDAANDALHETRKAAEANPLAAVGAGIAIGLVIGALLPKTKREDELLGATGRRLTNAASEAVGAAREAAKAELATLPLSKDAARAQVSKLVDQAAGALAAAGNAALKQRDAATETVPAKPAARTAK